VAGRQAGRARAQRRGEPVPQAQLRARKRCCRVATSRAQRRENAWCGSGGSGARCVRPRALAANVACARRKLCKGKKRFAHYARLIQQCGARAGDWVGVRFGLGAGGGWVAVYVWRGVYVWHSLGWHGGRGSFREQSPSSRVQFDR